MIYKFLEPNLHLKEYIREYLLFHFVVDEKISVPVKPYPAVPEQGITFYIKGPLLSETTENSVIEKRAKTVIFGQPVFRQTLHLPNEYMMFNIRFQPGALFKLLRIPMTEFVHKNIDAESVFGKEIREVNEQLVNAENFSSMLPIIETFIYKKIKQIKVDTRPIDKIGRSIIDNPEDFELQKMAAMACLCPKQFERNFTQQIGISPKFFARISRFNKAFEKKENNKELNWLQIAIHTGYHDYQHLVKDFKQFAGTTPNSLIQENTASPEKWLGLDTLAARILKKG